MQVFTRSGLKTPEGQHENPDQCMEVSVPKQLAAACSNHPNRVTWLERLSDLIHNLAGRWSLTIGTPFDGDEVSCAWVAPVMRANGSSAVLKLGMPHMEAEHELHGLRFWDGDPTVRLLAYDECLNTMLLERCEPGTVLRALPETEQDLVICRLLRRLWRRPSTPHPFRPLSAMIAQWSDEVLAKRAQWPDAGLVREALALFEQLPRTAPVQVLLATDLHAGNVLQARREPWLVIDPKPFVGDPAYDATQHLYNCQGRLRSSPDRIIRRVVDLLEVDHERVRLWMFARAAVDSSDGSEDSMALAQALAP